jgi:hypothetical protein
MPNFVDWVINTDWGTPLLILTLGLLIGLALLATLSTWLDTWCELLQSEADSTSGRASSDISAGKDHHWRWGWRTRHI